MLCIDAVHVINLLVVLGRACFARDSAHLLGALLATVRCSGKLAMVNCLPFSSLGESTTRRQLFLAVSASASSTEINGVFALGTLIIR